MAAKGPLAPGERRELPSGMVLALSQNFRLDVLVKGTKGEKDAPFLTLKFPSDEAAERSAELLEEYYASLPAVPGPFLLKNSERHPVFSLTRKPPEDLKELLALLFAEAEDLRTPMMTLSYKYLSGEELASLFLEWKESLAGEPLTLVDLHKLYFPLELRSVTLAASTTRGRREIFVGPREAPSVRALKAANALFFKVLLEGDKASEGPQVEEALREGRRSLEDIIAREEVYRNAGDLIVLSLETPLEEILSEMDGELLGKVAKTVEDALENTVAKEVLLFEVKEACALLEGNFEVSQELLAETLASLVRALSPFPHRRMALRLAQALFDEDLGPTTWELLQRLEEVASRGVSPEELALLQDLVDNPSLVTKDGAYSSYHLRVFLESGAPWRALAEVVRGSRALPYGERLLMSEVKEYFTSWEVYGEMPLAWWRPLVAAAVGVKAPA